ncbi:MAG: PAS domain S-box protein [Lentimicrobiaceae bacterium]|jgi:hypothetical protein
MIKPESSKRYLLIPVVLTVFFLLFYLVYNNIKERTINQFNHEQLILAQTASQGITAFFNNYQSDLTFLSQLNDIKNNTDESKALMASFYDNHKHFIEAISRMDEHGIILYTYPNNKSSIGNDISNQAHVRQVIATQKPVISDVFKSVQGYLAIAMHVPVFKDGKFAGSIAILIPIDKLGIQYLSNIKIRGTGDVWLLSENGVEIYCRVKGHTGKSFLDITKHDSRAVELMRRIKNESNGTARSIHQEVIVDGKTSLIEKYMVFYRVPLANTYWTIIMSYRGQDVYIALTKLRNRLILIFSLFFVSIAYYFYSLAKVQNLLNEEKKRKNAEKTLRESEEKFRNIFNESPIGIELYNADGLQTNTNKASLQIFGIQDVSEVQGFNLFDGTSLSPDIKEKLRRGETVAYQAAFDFEKVKTLRQYRTNRSGIAYLDYIITPLQSSVGKTIYGYLLQVQDVTERKRTEEEILMLAHSLRSVNECVSITDMKDKILFVNESFLKTYGYSEDELIGKNMNFIRSTANPHELIREILPSTLKGSWKGELINKRKDGSEFPIYLSTNIVKDKSGRPIALIGVASDITEFKRNEEELIQAKERAEQSDRLKSAFLANMSHEIRTPMNGILGFAELLKMPGLTGDQKQEYIEIIKKSGDRMLNIINDIVDISKIESGLVEVVITESNINHQTEFIHTFFKPQAEKKGIELLCINGLPEHEALITTDREKVYAILTNLVKNAIKYTDKGMIEFGYNLEVAPQHAAALPAPLLGFYVKDTGIGIPADRQQAIFDRFVQADITDTRAFQGAGLGLTISKAYVEMLGGKLWVESAEGKGSTFFFTIPYRLVQKVKTDDTKLVLSIETMDQVKKLKVLIVEDDETSEMLIKIALKAFAKEILTVSTGIKAIESCHNNPDINLVLMDIKMPVMDGYEATRQIREFNKDVVIIAQTAYGLSGDEDKALRAGCNYYISKPIAVAELKSLIQKHFKAGQ